jgi:hypothetical protein
MSLYAPLSAAAEAAYIQLYETAQAAELHRSISSLSGSIQFKSVRGKSYAYFTYRNALTKRHQQLYIGPDSPAVRALQIAAKEEATSALSVGRHAGAAASHGCSVVIAKHYRVIRQLADARFFRAGGLLIGSHAFQALGNMLGAHWDEAISTLDVDLARFGPGGNISVALPARLNIDVHAAIDSLQMGFLPAVNLAGQGNPSTYANPKEPEFRLDFLTPMRRKVEVVHDDTLGVSLQPMKFMDYLIEQSVQTVVLRPTAAVVVNVPAPARFALHKLIVAAERPATEQVKANKDVRQAASLLDYLLDNSRESLSAAWADLDSRGSGWRERVDQSLVRLKVRFPDLYDRLALFHSTGRQKG